MKGLNLASEFVCYYFILLIQRETFMQLFTLQAFIHPLLARFFWSVDSPDIRPGITWSPYAYCNGTFTATRSHEFTVQNHSNLGDIVFIDFAGSGIVHLCGKKVLIRF